jgi:hypothetical protein
VHGRSISRRRRGPCAAVAPALRRAADWLAAFPVDDLRFDAAVMLSQTRLRVDGDGLRRAFERARAVADRDDDNPQRFTDASANRSRSPASSIRWSGRTSAYPAPRRAG